MLQSGRPRNRAWVNYTFPILQSLSDGLKLPERWANLHLGVVSACLPSLRPLFKKIFKGTYRGPTFRSKSTKTSQYFSSGSSSRQAWIRRKIEADDLQSFTRIEEPPTEPNGTWGHNVHVHGGRRLHPGERTDLGVEEQQLPSRGIKVQTEVTLISSSVLPYKDALF